MKRFTLINVWATPPRLENGNWIGTHPHRIMRNVVTNDTVPLVGLTSASRVLDEILRLEDKALDDFTDRDLDLAGFIGLFASLVRTDFKANARKVFCLVVNP